ncbi:hypothetical protein GCM10023149_53790 [Mucilaginibacter gynuensis]|uniref:Uncharacterized protein n=2 Tax=Mucilaginibacter gynuensis TaxID=1302236 RepID=A0ABP8HMU8_9SPHI
MLSFEYDQFEAFRNFTEEVDYEELTYPFPDGTERIILRTPNRDINFTFSVDEWHSFRQAMDEALYMREVYMLIDK